MYIYTSIIISISQSDNTIQITPRAVMVKPQKYSPVLNQKSTNPPRLDLIQYPSINQGPVTVYTNMVSTTTTAALPKVTEDTRVVQQYTEGRDML